ncbi:MAG: Unknown protein [uncultured Thiotrichaceae bacterium]|uniref:Uncharacterized protein n=1 Tax=uncultured Thiotrichaceae bacterium TaxID=298394 RepID=A0A6S6STL4_9GAMM|nr:MAG: Unknown protein [uncultured Thiotrichaceae bacterium]
MIRTVLLAFFLLSFAFSVKNMLDYWQYDESIPEVSDLLVESVSPDRMNHLIGDAINQDRLEDAQQYLEIAKLYGYQLDYAYYEKHLEALDTSLRKIKRDTKSFFDGFMSGKGDDTAGISGAVTSDFTVVGDVRDLHRQYQVHAKGEEVNQLIVALSGVGIGLTIMTIGSAGSTASVKAGTSLFKVAVKTGRLTKSFSKELLQKASKVFDWPMFQKSIKNTSSLTDVRRAVRQSYHPSAMSSLAKTASQMSNIRKQTSLADTLNMMKHVDNGKDLARLNKFTLKHKKHSAHLLALLGKGAIRTVKVLRKTTVFLLSVFGSLISGLISLVLLFSSGRKKA